MDTRTLRALRGSIRKWEKIVAGTGIDLGARNCPLCKLFYSLDKWLNDDHCIECPVYKRTRAKSCNNSPYAKWANAGGSWRTAENAKMKKLAQAELDFLRSLLPRKKI